MENQLPKILIFNIKYRLELVKSVKIRFDFQNFFQFQNKKSITFIIINIQIHKEYHVTLLY